MSRTLDRTMADEGVEEGEDRGGSPFGQLDLQHYLRTLRKYKWPIVLFTAAVTALAGYYAFTATPVYRATSTLLIESQQNNIVSIEDLVGVDTENQDYYQTQFELLRSRGLARRVIEHLNLWRHPELDPGPSVAAAGDTPARPEAGNGQEGGSAEDGRGGFGSLFGGVGSRLGLGDAEDAAAAGAEGARRAAGIAAGDALPGGREIDRMPLDVENAGAGLDGRLVRGGDAPPLTTAPGSDYFDRRNVLRDERKIAVVSNFMSRLSISPIRKTKLVEISFDSTDPVFAARVANTVGEQYIESYLDARMELTTQASRWLNERLTALKRTLDESQVRLNRFKQENGLVDVDGSVGRLNEQELLLVTAELAQARSELAAARNLYREVQALRDRPDLLESIPTIQADPLVQNVKIEKGQAQRELDELRNRYGERHPRVIDATSRLASLDTTLQGHIARVMGTIEQDYQLSQQRVASIESKLASGKQEIQAIGTKKFELDALEREVATNQEIYDTFFSRMSEAKSADGLEQANARLSDYAAPPRNPIKPNKQLIIALAALGSLALSMLMAFLYEQMDDTVKSTNDIEGKLGLRLLGILPLIKGGLFERGKDLPLSPLEIPDKKGTFAESVKTARTALCMRDREDRNRVVLVTSSVPGEGKSTSAINLAYSLAQLERVLLIDCDMRRPTVAKAVGLEKNAVGLSNLITRTAGPRECMHRGVFDGAVDVLPSGPIPDQPLELLSSKRFEKLIEKLAEHYDRIVIDCAPTQAVSDALVLGRVCDAVIYVVKSHDTSIELVRRGVQRLRQVGATVAGVLITQVDIDKITSYGGDYYYQGYYDYYGYTDEESGGRKPGGRLKLSQEELMEIRNDESEIDLDFGFHGVSRFGRASEEDAGRAPSAPSRQRAEAERRSHAEGERAREPLSRDRRGRGGIEERTTLRREGEGSAADAPRRRIRDDLDIV